MAEEEHNQKCAYDKARICDTSCIAYDDRHGMVDERPFCMRGKFWFERKWKKE